MVRLTGGLFSSESEGGAGNEVVNDIRWKNIRDRSFVLMLQVPDSLGNVEALEKQHLYCAMYEMNVYGA